MFIKILILSALLLMPGESSVTQWYLEAGRSVTMDIPLPARPPSQLSPLKMAIEVVNSDRGRSLDLGSVFFSSSYTSHINTWVLNITEESKHQISKKTLCFSRESVSSKSDENVTVVAFSNTEKNKTLRVDASWDFNFVLRRNEPLNITLTPSSPKVLYYELEDDALAGDMFLTITTIQNPDKCVFVAINDPGCPWHDQISTVQNSKQWARILETGYFNIRATDFPKSFTVSLVPLQNSSGCWSRGLVHGEEEDVKVVTITAEKSFSFYRKPMMVVLVVLVVLAILFMGVWYSCWRIQLGNNRERILQHSKYIRRSVQISVRTTIERRTTVRCAISPVNAMRHNLVAELEKTSRPCNQSVHRLLTDKLTLPDMSRVQEEDEAHKEKRSKSYLHLVPLLSLFYIVPSAQMIFAEAQKEKDLGSEESCFSNYGCSRSWWIFDDFNHIISNCGYVIYGLMFICLVRTKSMILKVEQNLERQIFGSKQQYSIFYTLGICMILQGICSGIFHLCPSNTSLQFDTTIMYIMLILAFIKIYQFRHPDLVFDAFHVMYIFCSLIVLEASSIYIFTKTGKVLFNIVFVLFYFCAFFNISFSLYYYGLVNISNLPIILKHSFNNFGTCLYPKRFACCVISGILNFIVMVFTVIRSFGEGAASLSTPILIILAMNVLLFLSYYMINKVLEICENYEGEAGRRMWAMRFFSFTFFLLTLVLGLVAISFYFKRHASRNVTPQESRFLYQFY